MTPAPSSPNPPFSTQWKNVSRFFHTMEKMFPHHGNSCKTNSDDTEVVPPVSEIRGFAGFLEGRAPSRPFDPEFCKRPNGKPIRPCATSHVWPSFYKTEPKLCDPPKWLMFYKTISQPFRHLKQLLFYKTISKPTPAAPNPKRLVFYKTVATIGRPGSAFPPFSSSGFSLIELIVVIAVGALLAALTAGAWSSARAAAASATCKSNLRQLATANFSYAVDHLRFVAAAEDIQGGSANSIRWHGVRSGGKSFDGSVGPLAPYLGGGAASAWVRRCPGFRPEAAGFEASCGGYGYNALGVGSEVCLPGGGGGTAVGMRPGAIAHPAQTVMFADAAFLSGGGAKAKLIEYSFAEPPRFADGSVPWPSIHFRHRGKANVAWADGHVSTETLARTDGPSASHALGWFGPDDNELFDPF